MPSRRGKREEVSSSRGARRTSGEFGKRESFPGRFWSLEFGGFWIWVDLVGGRKREIFLPLGARTVETAGEKRTKKVEERVTGVKVGHS